MQIVYSDQLNPVPQGSQPNYNVDNPVWKLARMIEKVDLAAGVEHYDLASFHYLFPYQSLEIYGPNDGNSTPYDSQENKNDFQKQNISDFTLNHFFCLKGYAKVNGQLIPFLKLSYSANTSSPLSEATGHQLGSELKLWIKVGNLAASNLITVPYSESSDRYEVELWGSNNNDLSGLLGDKGKASVTAGLIQQRPDLIQGQPDDFSREAVEGQQVYAMHVNHLNHPVRPLHLELAWANQDASAWDSLNGANYHYEFNMLLRGWSNYIQGGISPNPHGGVGFLEFRNLFSNYFNHLDNYRNELDKQMNPWNQNAYRDKPNDGRYENFLSVEYMDLHILKPECAIGIHRHKDNQEVFMLLKGEALMITGDWLQFPKRGRAFEARLMKPGDLTLLKTGQLHSLINTTDEDISLFMFGGYD